MTALLLLLSPSQCHWSLCCCCFVQGPRRLFLFFVILHISLCIFLQVEPILSDLLQCWSKHCCSESFSRLVHLFLFPQGFVWGNRWSHLPVFSLVYRSLCWSCILSSALGSIQQLFFSHLSLGDVAILSANFHFIFLCVLFQHRILARSILSKASAESPSAQHHSIIQNMLLKIPWSKRINCHPDMRN